MLSRSTKPNRCKHCRERMPIDQARHVLHDDCIDPFLAVLKAKKERKEKSDQRERAKVERATIKARRRALETIPELIAAAQRSFDAFIRERDAGKPCICCGAPLGTGDIGGAYDCGHYRSRGSAGHLRFDERNAHAQNKRCNRWGAGRAVDYRIGLVARIGLAAVEALEADNKPRKWTREGLIALRAEYKQKRKALLEATV